MRKEPVKMVSMSHNRKKQYVLEEGTTGAISHRS